MNNFQTIAGAKRFCMEYGIKSITPNSIDCNHIAEALLMAYRDGQKHKSNYIYSTCDQESMQKYDIKRINDYGYKLKLANDAGFYGYIQFVIATYKKLKSFNKTAKTAGVTENAVAAMLHKTGISLRPRGGNNRG